MEWLKPITEKLNANILVAAVALTALGWWYFSKYEILLALGCCCAIYLVILFFYTIVHAYNVKKRADKREIEAFEELSMSKFIVLIRNYFVFPPKNTL